MKLEREKICISSKVLYASAIVVSLIAIAFVINHILLFNNTVSHYVAQGYTSAEVMKHLVPNQLLPGLFESVGLYGGISFTLFGIGLLNQKTNKLLTTRHIASDDIDHQQGNGVEHEDFLVQETQEKPIL